ncbi:MAG: L,D-transpeptidase [Candidatus Aminicenantes bacterium]|nr:L,D-transpeptidase [Candidatus Aminicenantes bacterium]
MITEPGRPVEKRRILLKVAAGLFLLWLLIFVSGNILSWGQRAHTKSVLSETTLDAPAEKALKAKVDRMRRSLQQISSKGIHIVIDSGRNVLTLKKGGTILREAVVSCGSGNILEDPNGDRRWIFDTPRGVFAVTSKITDPAWIKPDWAFVEEGEPVPEDPRLRIETGVLGDYALGFGDGFFIHGTLYSRLLGRNVTHGCIRVGDDDLKAVFKTVQIGTPIFIY